MARESRNSSKCGKSSDQVTVSIRKGVAMLLKRNAPAAMWPLCILPHRRGVPAAPIVDELRVRAPPRTQPSRPSSLVEHESGLARLRPAQTGFFWPACRTRRTRCNAAAWHMCGSVQKWAAIHTILTEAGGGQSLSPRHFVPGMLQTGFLPGRSQPGTCTESRVPP